VNIGVFSSVYVGLFSDDARLNIFFLFDWALIPAASTRGTAYTGILHLMFLHGGLECIWRNMLFLYIFGDNIEDEMATQLHLLFYPRPAAPAVGTGPCNLGPLFASSDGWRLWAIAGVMGRLTSAVPPRPKSTS